MRTGRLIRPAIAALAAIGSLAAAPAAVAAPPENDAFANAELLPELPVIERGSILEATREEGEPSHGAGEASAQSTVWYRWVPSRSGPVSFNTCSTRFDSILAVYAGATLPTLQAVASNDDECGRTLGSRVAFNARAGTSYSIAVGAFPETAVDDGLFELVGVEVRRPSNDLFSRPLPIALGDRLVVSTERARNQRGEPNHFRREAPAHSVWFRFRSSRTRRVTAATFGSSFDTVMSVYRGSSLRRLERIASNDDTGRSLASLVRFRAERGVTYRIAVDGLSGLSGDAVLSVR